MEGWCWPDLLPQERGCSLVTSLGPDCSTPSVRQAKVIANPALSSPLKSFQLGSVGSGFEADSGRRAKRQGVPQETGCFDVVPPRSDVFQGRLEVESLVKTGVALEVGRCQTEQSHRWSEAAFLQVHKRSGPLDQALVKGVVFAGLPSSQPEFFEHIMGFEVESLVEAVEETGVVPRQSVRARVVRQVGQQFGNAGVFVAHGGNSGGNGQRAVEPGQRQDLGLRMMRAVPDSTRALEYGTRSVGVPVLHPFSGNHTNPFVGRWMTVGGHGDARVEFTQDSHSSGFCIPLEDRQFNPRIRAGNPSHRFESLRVGEHAGALWRPLTGVPSAGRADFPAGLGGRPHDDSSRLDAFQAGRPDRRCLTQLILG